MLRLKLWPRVATALTALVPVVFLVWAGGSLFLLVATLLAVMAFKELDTALTQHGTPAAAAIAYPAVVLAMLAPFHWSGSSGAGSWAAAAPSLATILCLLAPALLVWGVVWYPGQRVPLQCLSATQLAVCYCSLFVFLPLLRSLPHGFWLTWLLLSGVWAGDIGAYYAGRRFGVTRLTPLSPGKSREGLMAGIVCTVAATLMCAAVGGMGLVNGLELGVLIGLAGPLGDLAQSLWKRELGVKDLGRTLPGHGGVLDRCDSLLFAGAATYFYAVWRNI